VEEQLAFSTHRDAIARWRKQRQQRSRGAEVKKISPVPLPPCAPARSSSQSRHT
jgi:hypothetical protein